jgi:hypothetical protein
MESGHGAIVRFHPACDALSSRESSHEARASRPMTTEPIGTPQAPSNPEPDEQGVTSRTEERLDELAQRFDKSDWIEMGAAVLLALATIMAAWAAYQATRWGGEQAQAFSVAGASRTEAAQETTNVGAQVQIDMQMWTAWVVFAAGDDQDGMAFVRGRFRDEFLPAFDAWLAQVPDGEAPPERPFEMAEYAPAGLARAAEATAEADAAAARGREANQLGDHFVLIAVIMALVLFFAGVGTKFKSRGIRIVMLLIAAVVFLGGLVFTFSLPQNVGF